MNKAATLNGISAVTVEDEDQITDEEEQSDIVRQWESLTLTHDVLFKQLARANAKLIKQNKRLKSELSVYRAGWLTLERENELHMAKATQFEKALRQYENDKSLVTCLIDGNTAIFNEDHVAKGNAGGREAAFQLSQGIARYLDGQQLNGGANDRTLPQHHQITASVFVDVSALADKLSLNGICSTRDFEQFVMGFNQASPLLTMVDVGPDKEAADAKMRGNLFYYSRLSQTRHVILSGVQETGSIPNLKELQSEGHLEKVTILKGSVDLAPKAETLCKKNNVNIIEFPGLFMQRRLTSETYNGMPPPLLPEPEPEQFYIPRAGLPWTVHADSLSLSAFTLDRPISTPGSNNWSQGPTSIAPSSVAGASSGRRTPDNGPHWQPRGQQGQNNAKNKNSSRQDSAPDHRKSEKHDRRQNGNQKSDNHQKERPKDDRNKNNPPNDNRQKQNNNNIPAQQPLNSYSGELQIDAKQGLLRQTPQLCYMYYLASCPKGPTCTYSHQYRINNGQLTALRNLVKRLPCVTLNNDHRCPLSADVCVMSHFCPDGPSCPRKAAGTCNFKGREMHGLPKGH